jgi:TonB family protein
MIGTLTVNALVVALLIGGALVATALLRRRSAAERHWLLAACVAAALVVPGLRLAVPDGVGVVDLRPLTASSAVPMAAATPPRSGADEITASFEVVLPARARTPNPVAVLPWLWLAGVVLAAGRLIAALFRLRAIADSATPVEAGVWRAVCDDLCRTLGVTTTVRLLHSAHPSLLATWGRRRPVILLPREALSWPPDRVRVVLAHELAHIARGDWTCQLLGEALRALHWFNPLAWRLCRRLRIESERASDDAVLALGIEAPVFADHLVALARQLRPPVTWLPAPAMVRPSSLEGRVRAMLDSSIVRHPASPQRRSVIAAAVLAVTVLVAALGAAAQFHTLRGTLTDRTGRSLPGAAVVLVNPSSASRYEVRSDPSGRFELVGLPTATYRLEVRLRGFRNHIEDLAVTGDVERTLQLAVGTLEETITVIGPGDGQPAEAPSEAELTRRAESRQRADARQQRALATCAAGPPTTAGGNILPPLKIVDVRPEYPDAVNPDGVAGTVTMQAVIDTSGLVREVRDVRGPHPALATSAVNAVRAWEFTPTLLNCEAIEVEMRVTVNFSTR